MALAVLLIGRTGRRSPLEFRWCFATYIGAAFLPCNGLTGLVFGSDAAGFRRMARPLTTYSEWDGSMRDVISGFRHLAEYFDGDEQQRLLAAVRQLIAAAPLYVPTMPNSGKPFSVRMTNCGPLGWVSSKEGGYRYQATHPGSGRVWPPIPEDLLTLWRAVGGYDEDPEACLVNWYGPKAKLGQHVDADEKDAAAPVISVSLGDDAWFRVGGHKRRDPTQRLLLKSGDVVVLGGEARLAYHGIDRIVAGTSDLIGEPGRFNLTLRRVTLAST